MSLAEFSDLVAAIYEGPLEAVPWKGALDLLRRHLRASYVTLMLQPPSADREALMVNSAGDLPITREAEYNKHYYALDPFVDLPQDTVVTVNELIGDANWRESEFYKQFLKPLDILHALSRSKLSRPRGISRRTRSTTTFCSSRAAAASRLSSRSSGPRSSRVAAVSTLYMRTATSSR